MINEIYFYLKKFANCRTLSLHFIVLLLFFFTVYLNIQIEIIHIKKGKIAFIKNI